MAGVAIPISIHRTSRMNTFREGDKPRRVPDLFRDMMVRNIKARNIAMIDILINRIPTTTWKPSP